MKPIAQAVKARTGLSLAAIFKKGLANFDLTHDTVKQYSRKPRPYNKMTGVSTSFYLTDEEEDKLARAALASNRTEAEALQHMLQLGLELLKDEVKDALHTSVYKTSFKISPEEYKLIQDRCYLLGISMSKFAHFAAQQYMKEPFFINWASPRSYTSIGASLNVSIIPEVANFIRAEGLKHSITMSTTARMFALAYIQHLENQNEEDTYEFD